MKRTTKNSMPLLIGIFLAGCVVCNIIGSIISTTPVEMSNYLGGILHYTIPVFLGRTVGLNETGGGNSLLFTGLSSLFFLILSIKLYTADAGEELSDFAEQPESAIGRVLHFLFSFFCLESFAYVVLDTVYFEKDSVFAIIAFLAYTIIGFCISREQDEICGQKFLCRILSTFGFIIGIAGLSNVICHGNLAKLLVIPSTVAQLVEPIALNSTLTWGSMAVLLLITSVCAMVGVSFAVKTVSNDNSLVFTGSAATVYIFGGYCYYACNSKTFISLRATAYWVLLLVILVIWAIASKKIRTFLWGFLAVCGFGSLVHALRIFKTPCSNALASLEQWLIPNQEKAFAWATELIKDDFFAGVLIAIVGLVVYLLLTIPAVKASRKMKIPADIMLTASKFFLCAVVVRFMDKSFLPWDFNPFCYYLLIMAASALIVSLLSYAVRLDLRGFIHCIVILLLTAVMGVYFAMFAPVVGLLAFAIFVALSAFGTIGSLQHYHVSPAEQKQQAYKEANAALDKAMELGADSREVSMARIGVEFHLGKDK